MQTDSLTATATKTTAIAAATVTSPVKSATVEWQGTNDHPPRHHASHKRPIVYLACPYTSPEHVVQEHRVAVATSIAAGMTQFGLVVFSPLSHSAGVVAAGGSEDWELWMDLSCWAVAHADIVVVLLLDGFSESRGVQREVFLAGDLGKQIYFLEPEAWSKSALQIADHIKRMAEAAVA